MAAQSLVGVVGGSGFYSLFEDPEQRVLDTPYGLPSSSVTMGELAGRTVAFLPRHGSTHQYAPHTVPYQANMWAMRALGVRQIVSLSAVGSLRRELPAGTLIVPDQLADRTHGRDHTFYSAGRGVHHISFADPFCPRGRASALGTGLPVTDGGTLTVVNGPRFSSRAESLEYQSHGWSIIGMTAMPEAALARELALCYTTLALVTDLDAGVEAGEGVTHAEVLEAFAANLPRMRELLVATIGALPAEQADCPCGDNGGLPPDVE